MNNNLLTRSFILFLIVFIVIPLHAGKIDFLNDPLLDTDKKIAKLNQEKDYIVLSADDIVFLLNYSKSCDEKLVIPLYDVVRDCSKDDKSICINYITNRLENAQESPNNVDFFLDAIKHELR